MFTSGTCCAHGYCYTPDVHVPVRVDGVQVSPDDLFHADLNGVTTIPKKIACEVAEVAEAYVEAEMVIINALRVSESLPDEEDASWRRGAPARLSDGPGNRMDVGRRTVGLATQGSPYLRSGNPSWPDQAHAIPHPDSPLRDICSN